ncbi:MAG TPA: disulfide bond formation protein B, partial [Rhabdaerophilum sp.]|nr:disulfide bond formation protein B [Rhabdaerophilum sp.]
ELPCPLCLLQRVALFGIAAVGFRGAIRSLDTDSFVLAATTTLACGLGIQTLVLSGYLAIADRANLIAILKAWRVSVMAGFMGAFASQFWFLAFALETVAKVRTLALVEVLFERETQRAPIETPEQRADCEKRLFGAVAQIADEDLKRHYRQAMRERLNELFQPQRQRAPQGGRGEGRSGAGGRRGAFGAAFVPPLQPSSGLLRSALLQKSVRVMPREAALVLAPVHHPGIVEAEAETFAELIFEHSATRRLRSAILDEAARASDHVTEARPLAERLTGRGYAEELRLVGEAAAIEKWAQPGSEFAHALAAWREAAHLHARQSFLNSEIDSLSLDFAANGGEERFERLRALLQRREALLEEE